MLLSLTCRTCQHAWELRDEPRALVGLCCPGCAAPALPRAAEDLATSLEDALCQLHLVGRQIVVRAELDARALPKAFCPEP